MSSEPTGKFGEPWEYTDSCEKGCAEMQAVDGTPVTWNADWERRAITCVNAMQNITDPESLRRDLDELIQAATAVAEYDWAFMESEGLLKDSDAGCAAAAIEPALSRIRQHFGGEG